jgi:hypothetical protein
MKLSKLTALTAGLMLTLCSYAQSIDVGRVTFNLPSPEWKLIASKEGVTIVDGGVGRGAKTQTHSFGLIQDSMLKAVLVVTATTGGSGRVSWITQCVSGTNSFAVNLASGFNDLNCAIATGPLNSEVYLSNIIPDIKNQMLLQNVKITPRMTSSRAASGNETGTYLQVNLIAAPTFSGLTSNQTFEGLPTNIKSSNLSWAITLEGAVKDSVNSFRGGLTLPVINWAN